uniref:interleukin 21 receptor, tandem duplicate 1 isoform X2 n=1 Tax=Scatophagus argus TaxID=75038 RepID=UPI001ED7D6FE|nr:interleukin 21 receptor, tandem duplicate 1 isoform X2 [Scatophagus argus]
MDLKPVLLLLLFHLALFVHGVTPLCNITCSTDYTASLNCSCADSVPTYALVFKVECSDGELEVNGTCEVSPPQTWCVMYPEMLDTVASIGTICNATVSRQGDKEIMITSELSTWALSDVVKPQPPFNVQVTDTEGFFNITWDHSNQDDCLMYRVRLQQRKDLATDPVYFLTVEEKHLLLDHKNLQLHTSYTVDVKAKMCPGILYEGPWSEWSSSAEWATAPSEGVSWCFLYISLSIIFVFGVGVLAYFQKTYLQKKFQLITYIPRADEFFKPLYYENGGNFKEWVKPVFSEHDYFRISSQVQTPSEKLHDILQWNSEKQSYGEDNELGQGSHLLHMLQPHSNSLPLFQDGCGSQGTGHSTGHISIHTVTLSGEDGFKGEDTSQSSVNTLRSYHHGESFGSFRKDNREQAGYDLDESQMLRVDGQSVELPQHEDQLSNNLIVENVNLHPLIQLNEPERVSLDSFASNEQSEDGYPHVDLDTIDSGFGECSSPGASDSNIAEQIDSHSFHEHKSSNSNYVKQWMACSAIQEDSSNMENELQETQ